MKRWASENTRFRKGRGQREDYKATVIITDHAHLPDALAALCAERSVRRLVVPVDIPEWWLPAGLETLRDEPA